ncbi:hypothetical protein NPIL_383971 [Nephila pilipes]|uniref:Uncharacterized protein n=1 Tax=Nephila pilipes TaxID=299642 RepID=A0A8X6MVK8_NEPPI|nr:hypothetical protein NPIL_383971 [Nephila pilipes]
MKANLSRDQDHHHQDTLVICPNEKNTHDRKTHQFLTLVLCRHIQIFQDLASERIKENSGSLIYREQQRHLVETRDEMVRAELRGQSMYVLSPLSCCICHGFRLTSVLKRTVRRSLRNGKPLNWWTLM